MKIITFIGHGLQHLFVFVGLWWLDRMVVRLQRLVRQGLVLHLEVILFHY